MRWKKVNILLNIKIKENKTGFIGSLLVLVVLVMTFYALFIIPSQTRLQWNNPLYWSDNPKDASPFWINYFLKIYNQQLPEHKIFYKKDATVDVIQETGFKMENNTLLYQFNYNEFPTAFSIPYSIKLGQIPPIIEVYVKRPDNLDFKIYSNSLDSTNNLNDSNDSNLSNYNNSSLSNTTAINNDYAFG